jgi:hypothetical protein
VGRKGWGTHGVVRTGNEERENRACRGPRALTSAWAETVVGIATSWSMQELVGVSIGFQLLLRCHCLPVSLALGFAPQYSG